MRENESGYTEAKIALEKESGNIAFLIGNGINRADENAVGLSWDALIQELIRCAKSASGNEKEIGYLEKLQQGNSKLTAGASLPEFFDLIAKILIDSNEKTDLQSEICNLLKHMRAGEPHRLLVEWAMKRNVPILTTNYDHCLQEGCSEPCKRRVFGSGKAMTDYYPWDRYYSPEKISDPMESFAIWHIHGDKDLKRSIRAGLDHYMGMVARLRSLKNAIAREALVGLKPDKQKVPKFHQAPWMRIFMGKKLWIQGLSLNADEVGLRWLLIQRARYRKKYCLNESESSGWFIHGPTSNTNVGILNDSHRGFLQSVGLEVIEIQKQVHLYKKLFKITK